MKLADWLKLFILCYKYVIMRWSIINIMSTCRTYSPVRTLNGIHLLQQVFGWLGFSQADTKNRNRCTTAEKIWREMAQLLSAVYSPLVWGCAVWPKSSCSTERLFRLSVCFDQAAATAGWQRFGQFFPVWICVSPQFEISWPVWSQKNRGGHLDIILLCERIPKPSMIWFQN